jgi:hypothetical protein
MELLLAPTWYHDGHGMLGGRIGDPVVARDVPPGEVGTTALETTIATGGWYTLVVNAAPDTAFEPCIIPAG